MATEYRRVEVVGREHVPASGPLLVVANHENSLVDSLALLHALPRAASPLAKAPLFKMPLLGGFLRALHAVPVFRPQDEAENEGRTARANVETFAACRERLAEGGALAIFPEGVSHPQPKLLPLRTGAARMALDLGKPCHVLPAGLSYEPPGERRGTVLVQFGEPFVVDGSGVAGPARRGAIATTTRRIEAALKALLAEAEGHDDLALLRTVAGVLAQRRGRPPPETLEEEHRRLRRAARAVEAMRAADPAGLEALRLEAVDFHRLLAVSGLPLEVIDVPYTPGRVARFLGRTVPLLVLGAPLAFLASVLTWPARTIGDVLFLRASRGAEDVLAVTRMLGHAVVLASLSILGAVAVALFVSPWAGLAVLVGLPAAFALHVRWRDWRVETRSRVHAFLLLAGGRLRADLQARRQALGDRLEEASRRLEAAGVDLDAAPPDPASS
jgi:1-acyl-sn-glycerol-3-phosphate acyltransferase